MENLAKGGYTAMDELFTIEEMMSKLKVSRETIYRYMSRGILPYVTIGSRRRFIGRQVMKAIRDIQAMQVQGYVRKDTLSDSCNSSSLDNPPSSKDLQHLERGPKTADNSQNV